MRRDSTFTPADEPASPHRDSATTYSNDVGPLFGQLASMQGQQPLDDATEALLCEAVSRALTGQASQPQH